MMLNVLSISLSMSFVILLLTILRSRINHRYCAKVMCILWMVVAIRMIFPMHLDFPFYQPVLKIDMSQEIVELPSATLNGTEAVIQLDHELSDFTPVGDPSSIKTQHPTAFTLSLEDIIKIVWLMGACGLLTVNTVSYVFVSRWLKKHCRKEKEVGNINIYSSNNLPESFAFGVFKPAVYLSEEALNDKWVLNHELIHCKHRDGMMQALMCLVKCMHWFNPFVYLMEKQWDAAREMNCDETVLKDKSKSERIDYMLTLYNAAESMMDKKLRFTSGLLDGEHQMVERFKMIRMDKIKKTGVLFMSFLCVLIVVGSNLVGCAQEVADNQEKILLMEIVEHVESRGGSISATIFEEKEYIENEDGIQVLDHARAYGSTAYMYSREGMHFYETAVSKYQRYNELIDSLKKMNVVKINDFQINPEINISAKVNVNTDDGYVESLWFYDDGTMRASSGPEYGKREAEFYKVNDDVMEKLIDYVYQDFVEYWSSGKGLERIKEDPSIVDTWPYSLVVNGSEE